MKYRLFKETRKENLLEATQKIFFIEVLEVPSLDSPEFVDVTFFVGNQQADFPKGKIAFNMLVDGVDKGLVVHNDLGITKKITVPVEWAREFDANYDDPTKINFRILFQEQSEMEKYFTPAEIAKF